jgi:M61 glycyl aminopeptidase
MRPLLLALFSLVLAHAEADEVSAQYTLRYDAAAETMSVRLCVPHAAPRVHFSADDGATRYVEAIAREHGAPPLRDDDGWSANDWQAGECLSYRARLGRIADSGRREDGARHGRAIVTDPDVWLLRVDGAGSDRMAEVRAAFAPGYAISAPWHPLPSSDGFVRFRFPETPRDWLAHVAVGRFAEIPVALPGGTLRVTILDGADTAQRARLEAWLAHVSRAAVSAYGRLPLADVQVLVIPVRRSHEPVEFGESTRGQGHGLTLFVDPSQIARSLDRDWVAVHELSHLFHPYLGERGSWLAEGLATYYQNVLRARSGWLTPAQAWEQIDAGFGRGRAATPAGDTVTLEDASAQDRFMRIYWSGTAYWLEVDAELRRSSANRLNVDEALRRFDACCLPSYRAWEPRDFVARLDTLLGTDVFVRRFDAYNGRRDFPDLDPLYRELGIRRDGRRLTFDDSAPDASVRRAIMAPRND